MENRLEIVITMGGLGSRFRKAGYKEPKYMIEAGGKTLFEWSMASLEGYSKDAAEWVFIVMKDEYYDAEDFIRSKCQKIDIKNYRVVVLDYLTDGQATTALLAGEYWEKQRGLLIYNIDTYVEPGMMNSGELKGDGFIPCFKGEGNHWSFVRLDEKGKAVEIKEKERISDYCTLGAYYFKTCELYENLYREFYEEGKNSVNGERYVAPLYDYLLKKGGEIYISCVPKDKVNVLGTPEELSAFLQKLRNDAR